MFDNKQDSACKLTNGVFCNIVAEEMLNCAKEKNTDFLYWRTVDGIAKELYWRYVFYDNGILGKKAEIANIGSMKKDKPGYDGNAFVFEGM